jgi:hypothetical protein
MFGKPSLRQDYAGIIKQIERGERLPPHHHPPRSIRDSGFESFITPVHEVWFEHFRWFGVMMNQKTSEPWCIEELPDTLVRDHMADMPEIGRRYKVFYNSADMGTLEVLPAEAGLKGLGEWELSPMGRAILQLDHLQFAPWDDARSLVAAVEVLMGPYDEPDAAWERAIGAANAALSGHLWEVVRVPDVAVAFYHAVYGPYDDVRRLNAHWESLGIDPMEKWAGDRPQPRRTSD